MIKNTIIVVLIASLVASSFVVLVQSDVMNSQLYRIDRLERENRQLDEKVDKLLEEAAGIKIEKVPDDLLIH